MMTHSYGLCLSLFMERYHGTKQRLSRHQFFSLIDKPALYGFDASSAIGWETFPAQLKLQLAWAAGVSPWSWQENIFCNSAVMLFKVKALGNLMKAIRSTFQSEQLFEDALRRPVETHSLASIFSLSRLPDHDLAIGSCRNHARTSYSSWIA